MLLNKMNNKITKDQLVGDLQESGLTRGDVVNVKASLKSIGPIEGGAKTLIDALSEVVGSSGTIVTDSFVTMHSPFSKKFWVPVNSQTPSYAGALANAMINYPNAIRTAHPVQKFAILGYHAPYLASMHSIDAGPYDVLKVMATIGGVNLKIGADEMVPGVGTTHVAICEAGIRQKRPLIGVRYLKNDNTLSTFIVNWPGGCMDAFYNLNQQYEQIDGAVISRGHVGHAKSKITSMEKTLKFELEQIYQNPESFLKCGSSTCVMCKFSWENMQDNWLPTILKALKNRDIHTAAQAIRYNLFYSFRPSKN